MKKTSRLISQKSNYSGDFGFVFRSSGIFYFKKTNNFRTTISFMDYWSLRQNISVRPVASIRNMMGELVRREPLDFSKGMVINYSPDFEEDFEGSVEIEIFSIEDLKIPYAALMVIYEATNSVTMVHGYTRSYSQHEIEEGRTITDGNEACIPICCYGITEIVLHNGSDTCGLQKATFEACFDDGEKISKEISLPILAPYQTVKLNLSEYFPEKIGKVDFGEGHLSFKLSNGFTRLLCINRSDDEKCFQVTHSDFNYRAHDTDFLDHDWAMISLPNNLEKIAENVTLLTWGANREMSVEIKNKDSETSFNGTSFVFLEAASGSVIFYKSKDSKKLPSRIHNALAFNFGNYRIPAICNLGVLHMQRPPKRMWWAIVGGNPSMSTGISVASLETICGDVSKKIANIRIYSESTKEYISFDINVDELLERGTFFLEEVFPGYIEFLSGNFGYITIYSEYPGLFIYTFMIHRDGSLTIEHGF